MKENRQLFFVFFLTFMSAAAFADQQQIGEKWALLIGADDYQALGKLEFCGDDARALGDVLRSYAGFENVAVLTDDAPESGNRPTHAAIRRRIAGIADLAGPDDTLLVFFSGHGITKDGRGYLVPVDGDADNAISMDWVRSTLLSSEAERRMLIIDACHAGSGAKGISGIVPDFAAPDLVMLMSSDADQVSYPNADRTHSIFTEKLLDGMRGEAAGEDVYITVSGLYDYVSREMRRWSFSTGRSQTPVLYPERPPDISLARLVDRKELEKRERLHIAQTAAERRRIHFDALTEGINFQREGKVLEAEAAFQRALTVPGYEDAEEASERLEKVQPAARKKRAYDTYLSDAKAAYERAEETNDGDLWRILRDTAQQAIGTGYEDVSDAEKYLMKAQEALLPVTIPDGLIVKTNSVSVITPEGKKMKEINYFVNSIGMKFTKIPPGEFMRRGGGRVRLTNSFFVGATQVTQQQWEAVMGDNPSHFEGEDRPVENVSWEDAKEFCKKLSELEPGLEYRLPTEAEWEYAARAGSANAFYTGRRITTEQANFNGRHHPHDGLYRGETLPVGTFPPNAFGLYDMHGNVWEWCSDWYDDYPRDEVVNPTGPESQVTRLIRSDYGRVMRGGSYRHSHRHASFEFRYQRPPEYSHGTVGFRIVMDP